MHTEVFNNIDTLINMASSQLNIDEINSELITLRKQIKNKKNEIEDLESLISDARYFNASNELVDKNIEISLKNKITRFNKKLKGIKTSISEISQNEKKLHEDIIDLKNKLNKNEDYVNIIKAKVENNKNNKYYTNLLKKEQENVNELNKELTEKNKEYTNILKELELNNQALLEINNKLDNEKSRLNDILDNLKNPNTYIDEDLKATDKEKLNKLKEELNLLEKRELELLTDAKVIGTDAKELIAKKNISEALNKIKELVTIVKTKPYMDITNLNILDEELEKKETQRIELTNLIDTKNYEGINSSSINKRLEYIEQIKENNLKSIANYENEINIIDEFINETLGKSIIELEDEVLKSEKTLKEYRELLKDKNKSVKTRANLENAINKKESEKKVLDNLLRAYKEDLIKKINDTNLLNELIKKLKEENTDYEEERVNLEKASMLDFKTKDLIEEEKDKENLKKINEEIKQIKNRSKFDKTPNEIYDQIEMLISTIKEAPALRIEKNKNKTLEIDNLYEPVPPKETKSERIKVIEMIPVETIKKQGGGN